MVESPRDEYDFISSSFRPGSNNNEMELSTAAYNPQSSQMQDSILSPSRTQYANFNEDFNLARLSIRTGVHVDNPGFVAKTPQLINRIQFCKNRMVEKQLNLECGQAYNVLLKIGNPHEKTSPEHVQLYAGFADLVMSALTCKTHPNIKEQLGRALDWFFVTSETLDFRHKARGAAYDQQVSQMQDLSATRRLHSYLRSLEDQYVKSERSSDRPLSGSSLEKPLKDISAKKPEFRYLETINPRPSEMTPLGSGVRNMSQLDRDLLNATLQERSSLRVQNQIRRQILQWTKTLHQSDVKRRHGAELLTVASRF